MKLQRGDILMSKSGLKLVVRSIRKVDDNEDQIMTVNFKYGLRHPPYTMADIRSGLLTPNGEKAEWDGKVLAHLRGTEMDDGEE